jgi:hypothetical protein
MSGKPTNHPSSLESLDHCGSQHGTSYKRHFAQLTRSPFTPSSAAVGHLLSVFLTAVVVASLQNYPLLSYPGGCIKSRAGGSRMFRRRSISAKMLVPIIASMLLCGIVAAEFPELLSLVDNVSNDFTIRKAGSAECAPMLRAANHKPIPLNRKDSEYGTHIRWAATFGDAKPPSSELFVFHSVLRT